jgi:hypothetical protein
MARHSFDATHFSFAFASFSFSSLPTSEVGFDGPALGVPVSPSCPRRMIFFGRIAGGGVLLVETVVSLIIDDKDGGTRQKGVLKMRTEPM